MSRKHLLTLFSLIVLLVLSAISQPPNPQNPGMQCDFTEQSPSPLTDVVGTRRILWIVCAGDSNSLPHNWPVHRWTPDTAGTRVMYPSTYRMPTWAPWVFDSTIARSFTKYYIDQSDGRFRVIGDVVGRNDSTIFVCDPDTAVRPRKVSGFSGGNAFFQNIMQKVDSVIDFRDYIDNPSDTVVSFMFFNVYGHAENCQVEGGGQWPMLTYVSRDSNSINRPIQTGGTKGLAFWSISEQALSVHDGCPWLGATDSVQAAYWSNMPGAAHEYGHSLPLFHTFGSSEYATTSTSHLGYGTFDPMGYEPSFTDPENDNAIGAIAPYNPYYRLLNGWLDLTTINAPLFDYTLGDHIETDECLKIPANVASSPSNDQYFLAVAVTRRTAWDRLWPREGVMITHVNPNGFQGDHARKIFDPELKTGLFDWTTRHEMSNPDWGCRVFPGGDTCDLWTGESTLDSNTVTGLDSFDFVWWHTAEWPIKAFWNGPSGSAGNFYVEGDTFNYDSNPSSAAHRTSSPYQQDRPTMVHLNVLDIDPIGGTATVSAWGRHWSGSISQNATWVDSVVVDDYLSVDYGATLTIMPGTIVVMEEGASIDIYGSTLIAEGTEEDPIIFKAKDNGEHWTSLTVEEGELHLEYVEFYDQTDYCIFVNTPSGDDHPVSIEHCTLDGSDLEPGGVALVLWNSPSLTQSVSHTLITNVDTTATGMYLYNCNVAFDSVEVTNCDYVNSYIKKITGSFIHCAFEGRTSYYGVLFNTPPCTPNFKCSEFTSLAPTAGSWQSTLFSATGCSPTFGGTNFQSGVANVISDSAKYLMIMEGTQALPVIHNRNGGNGGKNDWIQTFSGGQLIQWQLGEYAPDPPYPAFEQFWSPTPSELMFDPMGAEYFDFSDYLSEPYGLCGGGEEGGGDSFDPGDVSRGRSGTVDEGANFDSLFYVGLFLESEAEYASAQGIFHSIACGTDDNRLRWNSMAHVVSTETFVGSGGSWIPALLDSLVEAEENEYNSRVLASRLLASFHLNGEDFTIAASVCTELLSSGLTFDDSIYVAMDLIGIQMAGGLGGGGLDEAPNMQIPAQFAVRSTEQAMALEKSLFDALGGMAPDTKPRPLPLKHRLYQNFPNPFNPTTQIMFDLIEAGDVKLTVYDILGREVGTLLSEHREAGRHTFEFNAAALSSGVYFYRLDVNGFSDVKKMLLMK